MDLAELGQLADRLDAVRADRLAADKIAADLKSEEIRLQNVIIAEMEQKDLSSIGGRKCILKRAVKERPYATNWQDVFTFIKANDAFDLLHKRITETAVFLRRDDGIVVPGIDFMKYSHITFSKAPT